MVSSGEAEQSPDVSCHIQVALYRIACLNAYVSRLWLNPELSYNQCEMWL